MDPDRWRKIEQLYEAVLERPTADWSVFLAEACAGDRDLRQEVTSLLAQRTAVNDPLVTGGALNELRATLTLGTRLGPYEIGEPLGRGGMGEVYKARDTRLGRIVAIKLLGPNAGRRPILHEARAVSALNHPNIVILYDVGTDAGIDFLVMEHVEGTPLDEVVSRGAMPLNEVLEAGIQIAEALAAAHKAGIVHRDIKPSNIIRTPDSDIKVLDFGVAKHVNVGVASIDAVTTAVAATEPGVIVGTVSYMSPEQTRGETLDGRSDIFSLGCVLYEAATGRLPFVGPSALAVMHAIATAAPPRPTSLRPDLPAEFDFIIERALAKDKTNRYASASELGLALRGLRQETPAARSAPARRSEMFVGREQELDALYELSRRAIDGNGSIVLVTGDAGYGKSALASAFLSAAIRESPELLTARGTCVEQYGPGEAYLPFLDALTDLLNGAHRERVMAVLRRHAPTWCLQLPAVFGSTRTIEELHQEVIGATKERMLREFGDAVAALTASAPLTLLLEDLHWSDVASVDLLRHLGGRAAQHRLLVVGTLRTVDAERTDHPMMKCLWEMRAHGTCEELKITLLGPDDISRYLDVRFRPHDFPAELSALIFQKTDGHPLFAKALVELLVARGDIAPSERGWSATRPLTSDTLSVPESVRGAIQSKLRALDEEDRRTLQYASTQGEEFISTALACVLDVDELTLEHRLDHLERAHRLIEKRGEEELPDGSLAVTYRFSHALYQNELYGSLLTKQRIRLHLLTGMQLARHYGDETSRVAGALALQFERGRDFRRAVQFLMQAADVATERYAAAAAESHYSHALVLAERLPPDERARTRIMLQQRRGTIRLGLGNLRDATADFEQVAAQARELSDLISEGAALNALANPFLSRYRYETESKNRQREHTGQADEELRRAQHALAVAEQAGDAALRVEAVVNLALRHSVLGQPAAAKTLFEEAVRLARSGDRPTVLLRTLAYRGVGHFFRTEFREAEAMLVEAVELAPRLHDGGMFRTALFFLGWTRASLGRISDALTTFEQLRELAERNADSLFLETVPRRIAWIHSELQDFEYAEPLKSGGPEDDGPGLRAPDLLVPIFSGVRSQARAAQDALAQGDLDHAAEMARRLLDNSLRHGPPKYVAVAHQLLADIAAAQGDLCEAERELSLALDVLTSYPAPLVEWKLYAALGRIRRQRHDPDGARNAFARATGIVNTLAGNVTDERLRAIFLTSPAVQEVVSECA